MGVAFSLANDHRAGWKRVSVLDFINEVNQNLGDNPALTFVSARISEVQRESTPVVVNNPGSTQLVSVLDACFR